MAKINSILEINGTIGGVSFYTAEGRTLARAKSSLTKEKVMKDPAFARSREQMSEFGGAAALGSVLRSIWTPFRKRAADSRLAGRLNAQLLKTLKNAPGLRGQRSFILRDHAALLTGFRLRKHIYMSSIVDAPLFIVSPDRREAELTFAPWAEVKAAKGATHYRVIAAMGLLSDWIYDASEKRHQAIDPEHHGLRAIGESPETALNSASLPAIQLQLPTGVQPTATDSVIIAWGIEYLQNVNGVYESLHEFSAMEIGWVG